MKESIAYPPAVVEILSIPVEPSLVAGRPTGAARAKLDALDTDAITGGKPTADANMVVAAIAGLWLYHNYLDESHTISQCLETPTGSFWHGIMHRREPDYDNSRYWFRRVGRHAAFDSLAEHANVIGGGDAWDPFAFIDACERAVKHGGAAQQTCLRIQRAEWKALMDHCMRHATAEGRGN